ncbi:MAG: hypothetical protein N2444_00435, partial [Methylocystis sp.]|nr:hypothetical protein [Methylocystis sp.]
QMCIRDRGTPLVAMTGRPQSTLARLADIHLDVSVPAGETSDLRLFLRAGGKTLTETWTFPWTAPAN